jgi:hypothetical protein
MKKPLLAAVAAVLWVLVGIMVWSFFDRVPSAAADQKKCQEELDQSDLGQALRPRPLIGGCSAPDRIMAPAPSIMQNRQEPRIQVTGNIFVQSPANDIDASVKAQEHARQLLYETAGKECETLRATIAKECQLESISVNVNIPNYGPGRPPPDGFMVNSTFVYRITLK